eukprot:GEMP01151891.1.p1 GENE.GEMP01151891.1~~GEMP01151891.1.p1  ORF type:complete len:101 (+),score=15.29 GEMP01151891.1:41-343(+)
MPVPSDMARAASTGEIPVMPLQKIYHIVQDALGKEEAVKVHPEVYNALQAGAELWIDHIIELAKNGILTEDSIGKERSTYRDSTKKKFGTREHHHLSEST